MRQNIELELRKAAGLLLKQPVAAAAVLSEILTRFPSNARAKKYLAEIEQRAAAALDQNTLTGLQRLIAGGRTQEVQDCLGTLPAPAFGSADLQIMLGQYLYVLGRPAEAAAHLRAATQLRPRRLACWMAAGNAAYLASDWITAAQCYDAAREMFPSNEDVLNNLGMALAAQRKFDDAEKMFAAASECNPLNAKVAYNRANAFRDAGKLEQAIEFYQEALRLQPDYASAANNLGTVLHQLGRDTAAEAAYLQAVNNRPDFAQAHRNLSAVHKYNADDPLIGVLEQNLSGTLRDRDRMYFTFARSKAHEDCDEIAKSFQRLVEANAIRKRLLAYDIAVDELLFATIRELFAQPLTSIAVPDANPRPVFILGMMRSGTTLVEQILASHSDVFGAGELETLGQLCLPMMERFHATGLRPQEPDLSRLREEYLSEISRLSDGTHIVVTDKMPVNFRWIGFILAALPEARIIHMRRDPIATCWSIFKHYFSSDGNGYAFDLQDVASYWQLYDGLMSHWQQVFPDRILDVSYEALTCEPEMWTRRIIGHAGLDWECRCLDFYKNNRAVRTASASQVRQNIYTGSSEAWRKYEAHLGPLVAALGGG